MIPITILKHFSVDIVWMALHLFNLNRGFGYGAHTYTIHSDNCRSNRCVMQFSVPHFSNSRISITYVQYSVHTFQNVWRKKNIFESGSPSITKRHYSLRFEICLCRNVIRVAKIPLKRLTTIERKRKHSFNCF